MTANTVVMWMAMPQLFSLVGSSRVFILIVVDVIFLRGIGLPDIHAYCTDRHDPGFLFENGTSEFPMAQAVAINAAGGLGDVFFTLSISRLKLNVKNNKQNLSQL